MIKFKRLNIAAEAARNGVIYEVCDLLRQTTIKSICEKTNKANPHFNAEQVKNVLLHNCKKLLDKMIVDYEEKEK